MVKRRACGHGPTLLLSSFSLLALYVNSSHAQCQTPSDFIFPPKFESGIGGRVIYNGLTYPRGIKLDSANPPNLLVVDRGAGIIALRSQQSGCNGWTKKVVIENGDLNHGIDVAGNELFVSSIDEAFRYSYDPATASVSGQPTKIVTNMTNTDHSTRTLLYQPASGNDPPFLIISRGSASNIDLTTKSVDSGPAQIRRFALDANIPSGGYQFLQGELLAYGVRNSVGLAMRADNTQLWQVENSADDLHYQGVDAHEDNPAEELNLLDLSNKTAFGSNYGYPSCFTVWNMTVSNASSTLRTGDQITIETDSERTDEWCSDTNRNVRPKLALQAHSAPLDITFYDAPGSASGSSLPSGWSKDAFVTTHGSWDRTRPVGYGVLRIPWGDNGPAAEPSSGNGYSYIVQAPDLTRCDGECIRPVGVDIDPQGRMFVSSDTTGEIFMVANANAPELGATASSATRTRPRIEAILGIAALVLTWMA